MFSVRILILTFGLLPVLFPAPGFAQSNKRLILKDGSYQLATKWELRGDRVHFFSAERNEWEDVPTDLIDWKATNQYEADRAAGKASPTEEALRHELEAEREEQELKSPHVAPGLRLPAEGGVFVLDTYLGMPELLQLDQSSGEINRDTARNVLRATINPVSGAKHTIELAAPRAKMQVHASLPAVYINLQAGDEDAPSAKNDAAELPWDRFRIVKVQIKGDKRIVGVIKVAIFGKSSQEQNTIEATSEQLGEGWIKVTPKVPLAPGEYAVAEMLGKEGMNSYVWDFGVHPDAPANLAVIKPDESELKRNADPPVELKKR
jgi:hypothetical protein